MKPPLKIWLINPFEYISETKALIIGIAIITISNIINSSTFSHFDGLIDYHLYDDSKFPMIYHILESAISLLVFSIALYISGRLISKSKIRFIDVIGMQALARTPFLITACIPLFYSIEPIISYFDAQKNNTTLPNIPMLDWIFFTIYAITMLGLIVWLVALMWNAFKVSCNVKGKNAIIGFIIAFIISDIIIKLSLHSIKDYFIITQQLSSL